LPLIEKISGNQFFCLRPRPDSRGGGASFCGKFSLTIALTPNEWADQNWWRSPGKTGDWMVCRWHACCS